MTLEVLKAGPLATVQDLGRPGYQRFGVSASGAMDRYALQSANGGVGNPGGAAAIEVALGGLALRAGQDHFVALGGADLSARINDEPASLAAGFLWRAGQTLTFGRRVRGVWAYLAVAGGIAVEPVMGSRSTYLTAQLGGFDGRRLTPGDVLPIGAAAGSAGTHPRLAIPAYGPHIDARVVLGPDEDAFTRDAIETFLSARYAITPDCDRMGYRLHGPPLAHASAASMLSDAVTAGTVQVPMSGQPIVLMAERQTTGGYPRIATVIAADLGRVAQLAIGETVSFRRVTVEQAHAAAAELQMEIG